MIDEQLKKCRQSKLSGMTCIRCDKKIGVPEHTNGYNGVILMAATSDPCKCVSPIKVDMNVVDHHMNTEMGYLIRLSKTNGTLGEKMNHLNSLKGYRLNMQTFGDFSPKYDEKKSEHYHEEQEIAPSLIGKEVEDKPFEKFSPPLDPKMDSNEGFQTIESGSGFYNEKFMPPLDPNMKPVPPKSPPFYRDACDSLSEQNMKKDAFDELVSATIGKFRYFAHQIYLEDEDYEYMDIVGLPDEMEFIENKLLNLDTKYKVKFFDQYMNDEEDE